MELHKRVASCFTEAIAEWSADEIKHIQSLSGLNAAVAYTHKEIQDRAVMDIMKRVNQKIGELNEGLE